MSDCENTDPVECASDDSGFRCDACDKTILTQEPGWSFKKDAPMLCTGMGFSMCNGCWPNAFVSGETTLKVSSKSYIYFSREIFGCTTHSGDQGHSGDQTQCLCKCAVCGESGHNGVEENWAVGKMRAFEVPFYFLLCGGCLSACSKREADEPNQWNVDDKFFYQKWCTPHMKSGILNLEEVLNEERDRQKFVLSRINQVLLQARCGKDSSDSDSQSDSD